MQSKKFRNKTTGEIVTQVPLMDIANYEEVEEDKTDTNTNNDFIKSHFIVGRIAK